MSGFERGDLEIHSDVVRRFKIPNKGDAALQRTATNIQHSVMWFQTLHGEGMQLIGLQFVPKSKWSNQRLDPMAMLHARHKPTQLIETTPD